MRHARDRRGRDRRRQRDPAARREAAALELRRRVRSLLANLKLLDLFERMPPYLRDQFYADCRPDPVLVFDASFPSAEAFGGAYADLRQEVRERFGEATVELTGFELAVRDYWAILWPLAGLASRSWAEINAPIFGQPSAPAVARQFLERAASVLEYASRTEVQEATYTALHSAVIVPLVSRSRMDTRLLHARLSLAETPRGERLVMTLYAEQPEVKYVRLRSGAGGQSGSRPMYRVGTSNTWNGIEWASWSAEVLKGDWPARLGITADAQWPVFVQSHALRQLRARLDVFAYADWAEHWMVESLRKPKIVQRLSAEELLVAFEVMEQRLGYLVVSARNGLVAVRTFLFLTMAQTPEGRMLKQRLKITQDESQYFRLHELKSFTHTDLKDDPELRQLMRECGCGHLFELAEEEDALVPRARATTSLAAELKQYVGLAA
jgi:hypothetical protein